MLQHVAAQAVADQVGVPLCPPEQVLFLRQVREQPKEQVPHPAPGFDPREAARDPLDQALE
ncbi:hypothetical protein [Streptomyces sp. 11x1]|uniref:hypothetical protein n=1 Tax=Streptomyces sp. 11x1 TaxID=3038642 RepID=UPI0037DA1057